jgi:hypothetical protein
MAYLYADTSAKVGFRPYAQTDPFGAAHMSGIGAYFYNRPFDPWELHATDTPGLHGLGQNHPFKTQAWQLHGLGQDGGALDQAVSELVAAGKLAADQGAAITEGIANFSDYGLPDPTDQGSWANLVGLFQRANNDLKTLESAYQAAGQPGGPMAGNTAFAAIGQQLLNYRQQYSQLSSQFTYYYTLLVGSAPSGISGLGVIPILVWVAGAAVFLITATVALYAIHTWSQSVNLSEIKAQTQQTAANTQQTLATQLAAAQASGDTTTAQAITKLMQTNATAAAIGTQNPTLAWIENNALWIGARLLAFMFVMPATGRRR